MGIKHASTGDGLFCLDSVWSANHIIDGDATPQTDNTYDLGNLTYRFAEAYLTALKALASLTPYSDGTGFYVKDTSGNNRIRIYNLDSATDFLFIPVTNNTGKLGTTSYNFKEINTQTLNCATLNAASGAVYSQKMMWVDAGYSDTPGDTNWHPINSTVTYAPFDILKPAYARVVGRVEADEAGSTSVHIYNGTLGEVAAMSWTGTGAQNIAGTWTALTDTTDRTVYVRYKAASATETVKIYSCDFQVRGA